MKRKRQAKEDEKKKTKRAKSAIEAPTTYGLRSKAKADKKKK